jgi:hypothetical protein
MLLITCLGIRGCDRQSPVFGGLVRNRAQEQASGERGCGMAQYRGGNDHMKMHPWECGEPPASECNAANPRPQNRMREVRYWATSRSMKRQAGGGTGDHDGTIVHQMDRRKERG